VLFDSLLGILFVLLDNIVSVLGLTPRSNHIACHDRGSIPLQRVRLQQYDGWQQDKDSNISLNLCGEGVGE